MAADPLGYSSLMTFWGWTVHSQLTVLRRGLSATCALQSNETFPAISATKLTVSRSGGPLGGLVKMLSDNCTCWQGGHRGKCQEGAHVSILRLMRTEACDCLSFTYFVTESFFFQTFEREKNQK